MTSLGRLTRSVVSSTIPQDGERWQVWPTTEQGARRRSATIGRALEAFFTAHHGRLLRLAGLVCGDVASAEDIVQTALERAWRSRRSINDDARLRPWLDRIVVREAARERRSRLLWLGRLIRPPTVTEIEAPHATTWTRPPAASRAARAAPGARGAEPAQRAVVVLHLHAGYTLDETAEVLGIPRETVRSRLRVARDHLRQRP